MFFEQAAFEQVALEQVVSHQIAAVEGEEEVAQPGVRGLRERVEDWMEEEFAKVVNRG